MKKFILTVLLYFTAMAHFMAKAQVSSYAFSAFSGTYTNLTGANEVFILEADDELSSSIPIGFNFVYDNISYSQVQTSSNGWLSFVTSQSDPFFANSLANANTIRPALFPLWDDLDGSYEGFPYYLTSGTPGSRVFTFEWRTYDWQLGALAAVISFQVKLYESTNIIQYIYRQESGAVLSGSASIGISGTNSGDYKSLNNSSAAPTASSALFTTNISTKPATGQVYQFAPPACSGTPTGGTTGSSNNPVCYNSSFNLSVTGSSSGTGITYQWQSSPDGTTWTDIPGATTASYTTSLPVNTYFRRTITCASNSSQSTSLLVSVQKPFIAVNPATVCVNSSAQLTTSTSAPQSSIFTESFEGALQMTVTNGSPHSAGTEWILRNSPYSYTGTLSYTFSSPGANKFMAAISDPGGSGSSTSTYLTSPVINLSSYTSLSLSFNHSYQTYTSDQGTLEVSTNGGLGWTTINTYNSDIGTSNGFAAATVNLNSYAGSPGFMFRFHYTASWDWWWAVDDVVLSGTPVSATYSWTASPTTGAGLPGGSGTLAASNTSITVTPTTIGNITYTVNTNNSCDAPVSVVLNVTAGGGATGGLVPNTVCRTQSILSGDNFYIDAASCNLMAKVKPQGALPVSGSVNACVTIDPAVQFYNGQPYVQRHFDIEPADNANSATAQVTLYATQAEFDAVNAADLLAGNNWPDLPTGPGDALHIIAVRVTQWHGTGTSPGNYTNPIAVILTPQSVSWNAASSRWEIVVDVNGFSGFYIHTGYGFPLPENLISFSGYKTTNRNVLSWQTATETQVKGFQLERSYDGQRFETAGFVNSQAAGGNSNQLQGYSFTDIGFTGHQQYYRLRQIGLDRSEKLSQVILLRDQAGQGFIFGGLAPNPAHDQINFSYTNDQRIQASVIVSDMSGRTVYMKEMNLDPGSSYRQIPLSRFSPGTYILKLVSGTGQILGTGKFVVQ
ncbi:MAG: T9SS type A sorting domain-containing protein [Chitinophagaceae bacterium]|nr:T9SS type A sorting domain-containing protein [Chitinophagaceae bacterium]